METVMMLIAIVSVGLNLLLLNYVFTLRKQVNDVIETTTANVMQEIKGMTLSVATARGITESLDKTILRVGLCEKELDMLMEERNEQLEKEREYEQSLLLRFEGIQVQLEELYTNMSSIENSTAGTAQYVNEIASQVDYMRAMIDRLNQQ